MDNKVISKEVLEIAILTNKLEIYRHALNQIIKLLEEDSYENWDKCIQIAKDALKY